MARRESSFERINPDMTPMIDVVFQLLTFFMLTLKSVIPEGDFDIRMINTTPTTAKAMAIFSLNSSTFWRCCLIFRYSFRSSVTFESSGPS